MHKNKEKIVRRTPSIADWGLRSRKYLLFMGGLNKREGVHYLVEAFKQLEDTARTPNNFKLAVVASGEDDGDYVKYLHTISEGRCNILFFCCARKGVFMKQLFLHAYLFVQPSEIGSQAHWLREAMDCALAPLVSEVEENIAIAGEDCFSFKAKDVPDLRDRLAYLLSRGKEVRAMGERAKKRSWLRRVQTQIAEQTSAFQA